MLRRILFFIGLTLIVMFAIITVATRTILLAGFSRLEKAFMERNVARVQNAVGLRGRGSVHSCTAASQRLRDS